MNNIDKQALTAESARESGNILLTVAARMARRELFTPLHYISELPQKVVSMRVFREALERSEETLQREVCKIVDGHDRMQKKLKEAEAKLEAAEKRIAELEAREVTLPPYSFFDFKQGSPFKSGAYCHIDSVNKELSKHGIKMTAAAGKGEVS